MSSAIGFAAVILVMAIFLPEVLGALEEFLLLFLHQATTALQSMDTSSINLQQ